MSNLPEPFSDLESLVPEWSIDGSAARAAKRDSSSAAQHQELFTALNSRLSEALEYLDQTGLPNFTKADQNLMNLLLSYAHVSLAIEVQGEDEAKLAQWRPRMKLTLTPADA